MLLNLWNHLLLLPLHNFIDADASSTVSTVELSSLQQTQLIGGLQLVLYPLEWLICRGSPEKDLGVKAVATFDTNDPHAWWLPGRPGLAGVNGGETPAAETSCQSVIRTLDKKELMAWFKCHLNYYPFLVQGCDSFFSLFDELEPHLKHCSSFLLESWECWLFPTSPLHIYSGAIKWLLGESFGCWRLLVGD